MRGSVLKWLPSRFGSIRLAGVTLFIGAVGLCPVADADSQATVEPVEPAPVRDEQGFLGPGVYVFHTRTRKAACNDAVRSGYVTSYVAAVHGIPGASSMRMNLLNSEYWKDWTLTVDDEGRIRGVARLGGSKSAEAPTNEFDLTRDGDRFTGQGSRAYKAVVKGELRRCRLTYDALLQRLDS